MNTFRADWLARRAIAVWAGPGSVRTLMLRAGPTQRNMEGPSGRARENLSPWKVKRLTSMKPVAFGPCHLRRKHKMRIRNEILSSPREEISSLRPTRWSYVGCSSRPEPTRLRPKPRPPLHFGCLTPLAGPPPGMVKRWAYRSGQRSFNWQSTAFVMRGLSVQLRPLALEKNVGF